MTLPDFDRLRALWEDPEFTEVAQWQARHPGAPVVGYLPAYAPRELVYAAGGLAVGLWGAGPQVEIIRGDIYYQSYICRLPRSVLETAPALEGFSGVIFPSICDVVRNLSGMWQILFPHQWAVYLDLPQNFSSETGGQFFHESLMDLATRILGHPPDAAYSQRLAQAIALTNRQTDLFRRLAGLRSRAPWKVPVDEWYTLLRSALVLHPEVHIPMLAAYLALAENRDSRPLDHIRVHLAGAFCEQPTIGLLKTIEASGCYIVSHDLLLGLHWFTAPLKETGDPFESLVDGYLNRSGPAPFKYCGPREKAETFLALIREHRADGVIFAAPSFCDPSLLDRALLREALETHGIPSASFKYAENTCQYSGIAEVAGTFSDSIRLWPKES